MAIYQRTLDDELFHFGEHETVVEDATVYTHHMTREIQVISDSSFSHLKTNTPPSKPRIFTTMEERPHQQE
jgi:hypothetical protein